jgi:hypothetical protein
VKVLCGILGVREHTALCLECDVFWSPGMEVTRTMKRELGTTMIPQKATQVSCDPSFLLHGMTLCLQKCWNDYNSIILLFYGILVK